MGKAQISRVDYLVGVSEKEPRLDAFKGILTLSISLLALTPQVYWNYSAKAIEGSISEFTHRYHAICHLIITANLENEHLEH